MNDRTVPDSERNSNSKNDTPAPLPFTLRLRSLKSTRQSMARVLREYGKGNISQKIYRDLIYGISQFAFLLKTEKEAEIETRLQAVEESIGL